MSARETFADLAQVIPWVQNSAEPCMQLDADRAQLLLDALSRAHVGSVLDGWLEAETSRSLEVDSNHPHNATVRLCGRFGVRGGKDYKRFEADTLELARAAAAKAIESGDV